MGMGPGKKISRRAVLSGGASVLATAALAEAPLTALRPVARAVEPEVVIGGGGPERPEARLRARPTLRDMITRADLGGTTGVVVRDLDSGETLEAHEGDSALMPASVTKVLTALYAIDTLGVDHRFATRLIGTGPVVDGVLNGDLVLAGGQDPVLDTDALALLFEAVGIVEVTGRLLVWAGGVGEIDQIEPGQLPHLGYNPGVSGINLNFNRVHFEWRLVNGDYTVAMDARSETRRPEVSMARMQIVDRGSPVYDYSSGTNVDLWSVSRRALNDFGSRWLPVRLPALYAGDVLRSIAAETGVVLSRPEVVEVLPEGQELARRVSEPLSDIVRGMLRFSTNLTAEVLGRAATAARGGDVTTLGVSAAAMSGWIAARYGVRAVFVDHSGLSDASRITAADMVQILAEESAGPLRDVLKDIRLVDDSGDAIADPPGVVRAKTGTLNFVSSLAGYLDSDQGRRMAFAIFSNDAVAREAGKLAGDEQPTGSITYNTRAKRLQQHLLQRWGQVFVPQTEVAAAE